MRKAFVLAVFCFVWFGLHASLLTRCYAQQQVQQRVQQIPQQQQQQLKELNEAVQLQQQQQQDGKKKKIVRVQPPEPPEPPQVTKQQQDGNYAVKRDEQGYGVNSATSVSQPLLELVFSNQVGMAIRDVTLPQVLDMASAFIQSGFSLSPPCSSDLEAAILNCDSEVDAIMADVLNVRESAQLVRNALESGQFSVAVLMEEMKRQIEAMEEMTVVSFSKPSVGYGQSLADTSGNAVAAAPRMNSNVTAKGEAQGGLQAQPLQASASGTTRESNAFFERLLNLKMVASAGIELGRRIQDALYKQGKLSASENGGATASAAAAATYGSTLKEIVLGSDYPAKERTYNVPDVFEIVASRAKISTQCCTSLNDLLRFSTCLCDKGALGVFIQDNWKSVNRKTRKTLKDVADDQCTNILTLPKTFIKLKDISLLDETKVCTCRRLIDELEEIQKQQTREMEEKKKKKEPQPQPFLRRSFTETPEQVLQFASLNEFSSYYTEQKIQQVNADSATAELIRANCQ